MKKYMSYKHGKVIDVDTYVTLDTGDEQLVCVCLRVLHEVWGRLLGGNSNEGNTFVSRLEPDDLGALDGATGLITLVTLPLATLSLLLLLGGSDVGGGGLFGLFDTLVEAALGEDLRAGEATDAGDEFLAAGHL